MENLKELLSIYNKDQRCQNLADLLQSPEVKRVQLLGLKGAQLAFILYTVFQKTKQSHLIIADDKEDAAYLQNNLSSLFDQKKVAFFPDSFKRPQFFEELNSSNVLARAELINQLSLRSLQKHIIVTYPEALFEQVVAPDILEEQRINIKKGEELDTDTVIDIFSDQGFRREDFVYEPGQYAIRGGIIDIFSYGNDFPYRIELFDEEVESIRTFNPSTQLSVKNIAEVSIVPNINTRFERKDKVSLFEVLPKDTKVWIKEIANLVDRLSKCSEKIHAFSEQIALLDEEELKRVFKDRAFIAPDQIAKDLEHKSLVCFSDRKQELAFDEELAFNTQAQPSFNKNFSLLIDNLNEHKAQNITDYFFVENPKQIERFYSIFEDLDANVHFHPIPKAINEGFIDLDLKVACYTDHQIFERFHRYKLKRGFTKDQALNLKMLRELQAGDYVTHIDHGIGRYSGLEKIDINGHIQESVRLVYKNNDILYVSINTMHKISKYVGKDGSTPKLNKIGSDAWKSLKKRTKKKVKDIAKELIKLYAKRKAAEGFAFPEDGYLQTELEASFLYEDTPDQATATEAVKVDMMKAYPMDRLICGDVGFGKTEIAIRAAFKAVVGGKQVAILVPTTILALQHYHTFNSRLKEFSVTTEYVNRFKTAKQKRIIYEKLKKGEIDVIIGTHALLSKDVGFKDLGLLVIDEEQKFGVSAKEKLRNLKVNVDTLTLTATPIPRTLQFSLLSARDLSIIRTPPPNRQPIHTEVRIYNDVLIKDSIDYEINRGGQVFFVHNRVKNLPDITALLRRLCPDVDIAMAHGQMDPKGLEKTLIDFIDHQYDVLVCTNIIETGLDIPNANTMIINNAHQFGMSDLHQLRGRVGRSNKKAFCYLFAPPTSTLTSDARKRLKTLEEFSELGSGFNIAMRDLDIRGAGNLLGAEQSGFISDIGYETYQRILEEAVIELKENEYKDLFEEELEERKIYVRDVQVDTDVEMLIPDEYISNIQERLSLYTELDKIENEEKLSEFQNKLRDRFGKIPPPVKELFSGLRLRWTCRELGFERVILKSRKLRCYFVENPQSSYYESQRFQKVMGYISTKGKNEGLHFKQSNRHLIMIKDKVHSLKQANAVLKKILSSIS